MNIAFIGKNLSNSYSGGRVHTLTLAYAFARLGYKIDYYTNNIPIFFNDLPDDEAKRRIHFLINKLFIFPIKRKKYGHIVMAPHLSSRMSFVFDRFLFYPFVRRLKKVNESLLWYIDFESPNWIYEMDPALRPMSAYKYSNMILKNTDIILSTTKIGSCYAKEYYKDLNPNLNFHQLYLAINSYVADKISLPSERADRVIFFSRFGQKHKNAESLVSIIESLPSGFELAIVGTKDKSNNGFFEELRNAANRNTITITFHSGITDEEKFTLLASAKLLIFSSKFEGYGLPPIEAQYVGTPVLCSDLPVLREVNPLGRFVDFNNREQLFVSIADVLNKPASVMSLRQSVSRFCTYERFTNHLNEIIRSHYSIKTSE